MERFVLLLFVFFIKVHSVTAQKTTEFGISVSTHSGTAVLEQKDEVDLNGFIRNAGEITAKVLWKEGWGLYAGIGTYDFQVNTVTQGEISQLVYHYLVVPFGFSYCIPLIKKEEDKVSPLRLQIDLGGYAGNLLKAREESREVTVSSANLGWNVGISGKAGLEYSFFEKFNFGLGIQTRRDLSDVKGQSIVQANAFYANVGYRF